jgi:hypothetical protein
LEPGAAANPNAKIANTTARYFVFMINPPVVWRIEPNHGDEVENQGEADSFSS